MSKYLRVFLMAMLAVVLIASVAMAGTTKVNYGRVLVIQQTSLHRPWQVHRM
jgi:hypothetical protein